MAASDLGTRSSSGSFKYLWDSIGFYNANSCPKAAFIPWVFFIGLVDSNVLSIFLFDSRSLVFCSVMTLSCIMVMMSWFYELLANLLAWWLALWWFPSCNLGLAVKLSSLFVLLGPITTTCFYCCFGNCIWLLVVLLNICFPLSSYFKASNCYGFDLLSSFWKLLVKVLVFILAEAELFLRAGDCCAWYNYWSKQDIELCCRRAPLYSCTDILPLPEYWWRLAPRSV